MSRTTAHPVDKHVGAAIRRQRTLLGMSMEKLAEKLDLTYQQVAKYELGQNRVSASRMWQFAQVLGVPVASFFEGLPEGGRKKAAAPEIDPGMLTLSEALQGAEVASASRRRVQPREVAGGVTMDRPLCIYHGNCADGFGAAWVVNRYFHRDVDFHPGFYGADPPDVAGRDVIMVDFSYKRPVLEKMSDIARSILVLDHHKTAQEDLAGYTAPLGPWLQHLEYIHWRAAQDHIEGKRPIVHAIFDMNRSGVGLAWDYFNPNVLRPPLIDHVEDRDLWRFNLDGSAEVHAALMSYPLDFSLWDMWRLEPDLLALKTEGTAISRKLKQDVAHILGVATRHMVIGGVEVPVANLPYMMASEAGNEMAATAPFAATYYDSATARHFSLRSRGADGMDVAEIAKGYGGGGHRNAAGFQMPIGWEGDR